MGARGHTVERGLMAKMIAGHLLVRALEAQGVDRVFCVPGESYLAVLDGLHDAAIDTVVARQEGGAAMMAEADAKLTGRPGIVMVTRGPGATNAASGVHVATQDSTPLILLVGQIARGVDGREAFQEVDFTQLYSGLAKWVTEVRDPDRLPETLAHAFSVAMGGRPGPVVIALPEDMLREEVQEPPVLPYSSAVEQGVTEGQLADLSSMLAGARRPIMILGGSRWTPDACRSIQLFAERQQLPVAVSFRRQQLFDHSHPLYAGDLGIGANPALVDRIRSADLVISVGARLSENPSQDFTLLDIPIPQQDLVHIHPGPEELGRIYTPVLSVCASPISFATAAGQLPVEHVRRHDESAHASYLDWTDVLPRTGGEVDMGEVMTHLRAEAPSDAIVTNGAGNYSIWAHRFWRFQSFGTQVAPTSGSMGYGLPAAVAAGLRCPTQRVFCFAGDGCLQMTIQELGVLAERQLRVTVLVVDNGAYGTIRMHQEKQYPKRLSATDLKNPDFAEVARAYGIPAFSVTGTDQFPATLAAALSIEGPSLIHLKTSIEALTPTLTIDAARGVSPRA